MDVEAQLVDIDLFPCAHYSDGRGLHRAGGGAAWAAAAVPAAKHPSFGCYRGRE